MYDIRGMSGKIRKITCVCIERNKRYRKQNFIAPFKYGCNIYRIQDLNRHLEKFGNLVCIDESFR